MPKQTAAQLEQELAKLREEMEKKEQALEDQKQKEIAELRAKREKGVRDAWGKVTQELVKADMVTPPDYDNISTDAAKKASETRFNKKAYEQLGEILGFVQPSEGGQAGSKRGKLNDDQKAKIKEWFEEGVSVAEMNKRIYTSPSQKTYQRVNNYVKKLKG